MCPVCNVTDGGRHHYDCPYDKESNNQIVERGGPDTPRPEYGITWWTGDGGWILIAKEKNNV